ncbi:MAG: hypothetical protein BM556_04270 [Bacteriovorax sp. MedPE-SWde]|nr:MAG: hypothetical protein BM556_04270 [Bacteriovorax sp. MedPE-SWde]
MTKVLIPFLISLLVRLIKFSNRIVIHGEENLRKAEQMVEGKNYALAVWHQNLVCCILTAKKPMVSMTSRSKDGEIAARTAQKLGIIPTRGSSSRGGRAALQQMIDLIRKTNYITGLTVDGPRGPAKFPKAGVISIAHHCKIPLVPYIAISSRRYTFNKSWDKFRMPLPFGTIRHYYGEPIMIEGLDEHSLKKYTQHIISEQDRMENELLALM